MKHRWYSIGYDDGTPQAYDPGMATSLYDVKECRILEFLFEMAKTVDEQVGALVTANVVKWVPARLMWGRMLLALLLKRFAAP